MSFTCFRVIQLNKYIISIIRLLSLSCCSTTYTNNETQQLYAFDTWYNFDTLYDFDTWYDFNTRYDFNMRYDFDKHTHANQKAVTDKHYRHNN